METLVIDLAYGTTTGRNHRIENALRPNQDALHIVRAPGCTAGVVTDGCGGEPHSEFGAMLGSRLVANTIVTEVAEKGSVNDIDWERVRQDVLAQLRTLANTMAGVQSFTQFVMEYLLFSIVGFVADNTHCAFFYVGDGIVVVNGSVTTLEPREGKQPVYLAYNLV